MTMVKGFQEISYDELMDVSGGNKVVDLLVGYIVGKALDWVFDNISQGPFSGMSEQQVTNIYWTVYNSNQRAANNWGNGSW